MCSKSGKSRSASPMPRTVKSWPAWIPRNLSLCPATSTCKTACASRSLTPRPHSFKGIKMTGKSVFSLYCALFLACFSARAAADVPEEAKTSFAVGHYPKAIQILNRAAASSPNDAEIQHLLARSYFESEQFDLAISAAERSVSLEPKNSAYHELLGHSYGERASRSGWFGALYLATKARQEFDG